MSDNTSGNGNGNGTLDTVRKLLAKAEGTDNPTEAEIYNAKAAELIAKYGIEQALLDANRTNGQQAIIGDRVVHVLAPYAAEKAHLLHCVASPLRVKTVRINSRKRSQGYNVHLFGFPADLGRVDLLFTSLLIQAGRGLAAVQPTHWDVSTVMHRKGWMAGFSSVVRERLEAAENRATDESGVPGTALVLADRKALADRRAQEVYPDLTDLRRRPVPTSAYDHGKAAGQRADLGAPRINASGAARRTLGQ